VGKCAAGHQTKLFQFFSTLGKGEDEGEVFYRKYIFLFKHVDKIFIIVTIEEGRAANKSPH
jgi:hypothetical protein